jgi:hypothetical protein
MPCQTPALLQTLKVLPYPAVYLCHHQYPPGLLRSLFFIVALLLILAIQTESSSISLTCAGLTELPRYPGAPISSSVPSPVSRTSKLNALGWLRWPGDVGPEARGLASGCPYDVSNDDKSALTPDQLRWWLWASSADKKPPAPVGLSPASPPCFAAARFALSSSLSTKISGTPSCGILVIRAERFMSM